VVVLISPAKKTTLYRFTQAESDALMLLSKKMKLPVHSVFRQAILCDHCRDMVKEALLTAEAEVEKMKMAGSPTTPKT